MTKLAINAKASVSNNLSFNLSSLIFNKSRATRREIAKAERNSMAKKMQR